MSITLTQRADVLDVSPEDLANWRDYLQTHLEDITDLEYYVGEVRRDSEFTLIVEASHIHDQAEVRNLVDLAWDRYCLHGRS